MPVKTGQNPFLIPKDAPKNYFPPNLYILREGFSSLKEFLVFPIGGYYIDKVRAGAPYVF